MAKINAEGVPSDVTAPEGSTAQSADGVVRELRVPDDGGAYMTADEAAARDDQRTEQTDEQARGNVDEQDDGQDDERDETAEERSRRGDDTKSHTSLFGTKQDDNKATPAKKTTGSAKVTGNK